MGPRNGGNTAFRELPPSSICTTSEPNCHPEAVLQAEGPPYFVLSRSAEGTRRAAWRSRALLPLSNERVLRPEVRVQDDSAISTHLHDDYREWQRKLSLELKKLQMPVSSLLLCRLEAGAATPTRTGPAPTVAALQLFPSPLRFSRTWAIRLRTLSASATTSPWPFTSNSIS